MVPDSFFCVNGFWQDHCGGRVQIRIDREGAKEDVEKKRHGVTKKWVRVCSRWGDFATNFFGVLDFGDAQIVRGLQIHPRARVTAKMPGETQRGVGADAAALPNDVVDPRRREVQRHRATKTNAAR